MEPKYRAVLPSLLIFLLVCSGCRLYGGYSSEAEAYAQMVKGNEAFAQSLSRAEVTLRTLQEAATAQPMLAPYTEQFYALVQHHTALLERHRAVTATLSASSSYRSLNRALGGFVAEQEQVDEGYTALLGHIQRQMPSGSMAEAFTPSDRSRYQAVPPFYEAIRYRIQAPTLDKALGRSN